MGFPCNQFMNQESGSEAEIKKTVKEKYNVNFPMFEKIEVNGPSTNPLYVFLRSNSELADPQSGQAKMVPWNFGKFLLDKDGHVVKFYGPRDKPVDMKKDIEQLLHA
jgi:glutathione peroxidase-family protein